MNSTKTPSAGPPWWPRVCRATSVWPVRGTRGRLPRCSRCRAWSHPGTSPAPHRGARRRMRLRIPLQAGPRCWRQVGGVALGTSPLWCSAAVSMRGRGLVRLDQLLVRVLRGGFPAAALNSQPPDDLRRPVQRRRLGVCFAWGRGLSHSCVTVPESRDGVQTFCGLPLPVLVRFMGPAVGVVGCWWETLALVPQRTPPQVGCEYCRGDQGLLPGPCGGALHMLMTAQAQVVRPRGPITTL